MSGYNTLHKRVMGDDGKEYLLLRSYRMHNCGTVKCTNKEIYNKTIEELNKLPNSYLIYNGYDSSRICVGEIYDERSNAIIYMLIDIVLERYERYVGGV